MTLNVLNSDGKSDDVHDYTFTLYFLSLTSSSSLLITYLVQVLDVSTPTVVRGGFAGRRWWVMCVLCYPYYHGFYL